ncbi:MAG: hypothetical protein PWQ67_2180 [Clostridia bacterium]|nr:hypothetical protein [Clostridia bacterium]
MCYFDIICQRLSKYYAENSIRKGGDYMPTTGEKPGKGLYECIKCGQLVRLDDHTDTLPPCPSCNGTEFIKVG